MASKSPSLSSTPIAAQFSKEPYCSIHRSLMVATVGSSNGCLNLSRPIGAVPLSKKIFRNLVIELSTSAEDARGERGDRPYHNPSLGSPGFGSLACAKSWGRDGV